MVAITATQLSKVVKFDDMNLMDTVVSGIVTDIAAAYTLAVTAGAVAGATIVVGAEDTNVRPITIQLTDSAGADLAVVSTFIMCVFADAAGAAFATTGGSTGMAIGTDGALLALVAKKVFICTSEADGDWDGTWTDTGTEAAYLGVVLPNGRVTISAAMTNG